MSTLLPCEVHSRFDDPSPVEFCRMCHETTAAALRSRVEALEGALGGTMEIIAAYEERESAAGRTDFTPTYGEMMDEARAAIAPTDKGERCGTCGGKRIVPTRKDWPDGRSPCVFPCPDCAEAP